MTAIQAYEAVLIELNKVKAPSLSLSDFLYFFNKLCTISLSLINIYYSFFLFLIIAIIRKNAPTPTNIIAPVFDFPTNPINMPIIIRRT